MMLWFIFKIAKRIQRIHKKINPILDFRLKPTRRGLLVGSLCRALLTEKVEVLHVCLHTSAKNGYFDYDYCIFDVIVM